MQGKALDIARYLARQASDTRLTTYRELASMVGWHNPTGRGMGPHLQSILEYTHENELPCLTATLVQAGTHSPTEDGLVHIRKVYGDIDLAEEQDRVFQHVWSLVPGLAFQMPTPVEIDYDRIFATRTWGFGPQDWGMTGFSQEKRRDNILAEMGNKPIYVVYFCSQHAEVIDPVEGRYTIAPSDVARVLGICEVQPIPASHDTHTARSAVERMLSDWGKMRWEFGLENSRAWALVARPWTREVLPHARATSWEATNGIVELTEEEKRLIRQYQLIEVPVYGREMREVAFALREPMDTTYMAICEDPAVLKKTSAPAGTKLVKIGVSGDTSRRLRDLNDHHFAKIFGLEFNMYATNRWSTQDEALAGETTALEWALGNATQHASGEYFYMTEEQIKLALPLVKPIKRVR